MPFTDPKVLMHVAKCRLTTEERKKDERFPVYAVELAREPLTYSLAKQLGQEVVEHCFNSKRGIRAGLTDVSVELDLDEQLVHVYMAEDEKVGEHCQLRQVRIKSVTITKRDSSKEGASTKAKKVGPQQPVLKASFECLIDPAEKTHRDFLALNFAKSFFFTFEDEQANLFTGIAAEDDDDEEMDDKQGELPELEDVDGLDKHNKKAAKAAKAPRLVKGAKKSKPNGRASAEA